MRVLGYSEVGSRESLCYIPYMDSIKVVDYLDYRAFLSDWVAQRKKASRAFSLRSFSEKLGLGSTSFLSAVIKGKKSLGDDTRLRLALALGLDSEESSYFELLVQFNQTKDMAAKNVLFSRMRKFRGSRARIAGEGLYRFYGRWYYALVWNYLSLRHDVKDPGLIAQALDPALTPGQVAEAIGVLLDLGLVRKLANGYEPSDRHWTTEPQVDALAVRNHVQDLLALAATRLSEVPAERRQYNTLMFQVSESGFATIRDRMRQFQEELRDILDRDQNEDRIYTLCMSLFPLTKDGVE